MVNRDNRTEDLRKRRTTLDKRKTLNSTDDAPRYVRYVHPENYFEIDYPAHWTAEIDKDDSANIFPKHRDHVAICFMNLPLRFDMRKISESENFELAMTALLEKAGSVNSRRDPTIIHPCMTADRAEEGEGGQRWVVTESDLMMAISTSFPDAEQHIWRPIFERMLTSFRIKREKEGLFQQVVYRVREKLTEVMPEVKFEQNGMTMKSEKIEFSLGNLFARVMNEPSSLNAVVDEYVNGLATVIKQQNIGQEPWEEVKARIVPMLKPEDYVMHINDQHLEAAKKGGGEAARLIATPWLADLFTCYAVDDKATFRLINQLDLERWKIDDETIHEVAMENLVKLEPPEIFVVRNPSEEHGFGMFRAKAGSTSAFLLHPKLYELVAPQLGSDLLAAIPNRDSLIVFGNSTHQRRTVQDTVRNDYESSAHSLTDRLFRLTPDGAALA